MTSVRVYHLSEVVGPSYWDDLTEEQRLEETKVLKAARILRAAADAGFPVPPPPEGVMPNRENAVALGWSPEAADIFAQVVNQVLRESWDMISR